MILNLLIGIFWYCILSFFVYYLWVTLSAAWSINSSELDWQFKDKKRQQYRTKPRYINGLKK